MRVCVLTDEVIEDFDPTPYMQGFDWEMFTMTDPVLDVLRELDAQKKFDVYLNLCEGYEKEPDAEWTYQGIDVVRARQREGWLGAIAGGLLGAILGDQIGDGNERKSARILGAAGGAYAGHQIERSMAPRISYDVIVRMTSGERRTVSFSSAPPLKVGERVSFADGSAQPSLAPSR